MDFFSTFRPRPFRYETLVRTLGKCTFSQPMLDSWTDPASSATVGVGTQHPSSEEERAGTGAASSAVLVQLLFFILPFHESSSLRDYLLLACVQRCISRCCVAAYPVGMAATFAAPNAKRVPTTTTSTAPKSSSAV